MIGRKFLHEQNDTMLVVRDVHASHLNKIISMDWS
jgi:arginine/lysine/ornithine decarboxylase